MQAAPSRALDPNSREKPLWSGGFLCVQRLSDSKEAAFRVSVDSKCVCKHTFDCCKTWSKSDYSTVLGTRRNKLKVPLRLMPTDSGGRTSHVSPAAPSSVWARTMTRALKQGCQFKGYPSALLGGPAPGVLPTLTQARSECILQAELSLHRASPAARLIVVLGSEDVNGYPGVS